MKITHGLMGSLVTPFTNGEVDENSLRRLINFLLEQNVDSVSTTLPTGEFTSLNFDEMKKVIEITVDEVNGRVPVCAGTGWSATRETIELSKFAEDVGADGVMPVVPFFVRPMDKGILAHFNELAEKINIPIIVYNGPGRTGVNLKPEVVKELSSLENIVGVKETDREMSQVYKVIQMTEGKVDVMQGWEDLLLPSLALGATGVVSVAASVIGKDIAEMIKAFNKGDLNKAREIHYSILPILDALFCESNPVPLKEALFMMGAIESPEVRKPLMPMLETNREGLKNILSERGYI
jgi:4-hydroxy-tetrahydrodipicolinate synthase